MTEGWTVGDLEPALTGTAKGKVRSDHPTLSDAEFTALDPAPVDLTAATDVVAHIQRADDSIISRDVVLGDQTTAPGSWTLAWVDTDPDAVPPVVTDLFVAGGYSVEIEVTWPGGRPQTFPGASFQVARQIA